MANDRNAWELLLLRYDIERGDERNERGVFAARIGSLIAVLALTAVFLREAGELPRWVHVSVPAAPLAILALLAYVMQVAERRWQHVRQLESPSKRLQKVASRDFRRRRGGAGGPRRAR